MEKIYEKIKKITIITTLCLITILNTNTLNCNTIVTKATNEYESISYLKSQLQLTDLFNYKEYLELYPELNYLVTNKTESDTNSILFNHFSTTGILEGRQPSKSFNIYVYKSAYTDLQLAFGNDILKYYEHYLNFGYKEGRNILTIEQANSLGIDVTDFNNNKITDLSNNSYQNKYTNLKEINHNHTFGLQNIEVGNYSFTNGYTIKYCDCGAFQLIPIHK